LSTATFALADIFVNDTWRMQMSLRCSKLAA